MSNIITAIDHADNFVHQDDEWIGVAILTASPEQTIKVLINDFHSCCERYDVLCMTPENNKEGMIGATIHKVGWGKDILPAYMDAIRRYHHDNFDGAGVARAIVDIETDKGLIQIIAYNEHNGYYPHSVYVQWPGYTDTQEI